MNEDDEGNGKKKENVDLDNLMISASETQEENKRTLQNRQYPYPSPVYPPGSPAQCLASPISSQSRRAHIIFSNTPDPTPQFPLFRCSWSSSDFYIYYVVIIVLWRRWQVVLHPPLPLLAYWRLLLLFRISHIWARLVCPFVRLSVFVPATPVSPSHFGEMAFVEEPRKLKDLPFFLSFFLSFRPCLFVQLHRFRYFRRRFFVWNSQRATVILDFKWRQLRLLRGLAERRERQGSDPAYWANPIFATSFKEWLSSKYIQDGAWEVPSEQRSIVCSIGNLSTWPLATVRQTWVKIVSVVVP